MTADKLAEIIRKVDDKHKLGAGALAEAIMSELDKGITSSKQPVPDAVEIDPKDLIVQLWSSKPKSGWDYTLACGVKITHVPSGITVTCDTERSTHANKNKALGDLQSQLAVNPAPDVDVLEEALEAISRNELDAQRAQHVAAEALATHRNQRGKS